MDKKPSEYDVVDSIVNFHNARETMNDNLMWYLLYSGWEPTGHFIDGEFVERYSKGDHQDLEQEDAFKTEQDINSALNSIPCPNCGVFLRENHDCNRWLNARDSRSKV